MLRKVGENDAFANAVDDAVLDGSKPVFGPLSKSVADAGSELGMNLYDQFGNMMLILFAGHDTTAHPRLLKTLSHSDHSQPHISACSQSELLVYST